MIVWVASYPRSGNRLCRTILQLSVGKSRVSSGVSEATLRNDLKPLLDRLGVGPDDDPLPALREHDEAIFLKTHMLPERVHRLQTKGPARELLEGEVDSSPALHVVRDGRDCLVSLAHFLQKLSGRPRFQRMSFEEAVAELIRLPVQFGDWSGNVGAWRRREAPTEVVRFEDLVEDPIAAVRASTTALGFDLPKPRRPPPTFEELRARSRRPELLRRGKAGAWRSEFPPELLDEFWDHHGEEMEAFGYPRE